jgi:AraC family transcriptional regulator
MGHQLKLGHFYGQVTGKAEVSDVALSELAHRKPCKHGLHSHEAPYFSLLLQGTYSETFSGKVLQYRPMTMAFHPPNTTHSDEVGGRGGLFFIIELKREWLRKLPAYSMGVEILPDLTGGKATSMAARLYHDNKSGCTSVLEVESSVFEMMAEVSRLRQIRERGQPGWMKHVRDLLHGSFTQPLTVEFVASQVGVHPVHLSRVFRTRCGQTLGEYLNGLRVRFACERLLTGELVSLADLAIGAGFADQSHFCRVFKAMVGSTPTEFRRMRLEQDPSTGRSPLDLKMFHRFNTTKQL